MRQVINGKRYDTETAKLIGEANNIGSGCDSVTDFRYWSAGLYKTKSGNFFLAGEGGAMSMFSRPAGGNSTGGGEGIIQMDEREALEWAERNLSTEKVESAFGHIIEEA